MKNLQVKTLAAAILMGGSLLVSSGASASAATETLSVTAGTACEAYSAGQETMLRSDWSTAVASGNMWVHCPGAGLGDTATTVTFNLEIPVDALTDVYNCYYAEQSATGSARVVAWEAGSDAGPAAAVVDIVAAGLVLPGDTTVSYTGGCRLGADHMLHSVVMDAP